MGNASESEMLSEFVGFRIETEVKKRIVKYARRKGFSIGEFFTYSALLTMGKKVEAGKILLKKESGNK